MRKCQSNMLCKFTFLSFIFQLKTLMQEDFHNFQSQNCNGNLNTYNSNFYIRTGCFRYIINNLITKLFQRFLYLQNKTQYIIPSGCAYQGSCMYVNVICGRRFERIEEVRRRKLLFRVDMGRSKLQK